MPELARVGPHGYSHGWIKVGNVKAPADRYPADVKFMKTEDVGKLVSDLEPGMTVEERYRKFPGKRADDTQKQLDQAIAKRGWDPSPLHVLNGERLTDGHHTYAAARARGVSHLPVLHYQRVKRMDEYGAARVGGWVDEPIAWRAWNAGAHPRAKAGTPTGGQFAPASGGSSSTKGSKGGKDTRPTPTNARPVGQGETGKRVSDLQARLNALGAKPPLKLDGIFGPKTLAAVRAFQKAHGLKVDGLVGPLTTAALRTRHTATAKPSAKPPAKAAKTTTKPAAPAAKTAGTKTAARVAGAVTNPRGTEKLHEYWVHGEGAGKIRWGSPGDFDRCVLHLGKFIADPKGYCAKAHHDALGIWPATHAAQEKKAGRSEVETTQRADASKKPYGNVTYADPRNGKYPLDTEAHIRAAWAYVNMPKNASQYPMNGVTLSQVKDRIRAAMKRIGADVADDTSSSASRATADWIRPAIPLEDIHIVRSAGGDKSGTLVEAYATVFDEPAEIRDQQGHYTEVIDRAAFDQVLTRIRASRGGLPSHVKVLYNHGKTAEGTPAPEFQLPLGVPEDIRPESRGLLTRTRYDAGDPLAERVLSKIEAGSITSYSFVGGIMRSSPELRGPGDRYRARNGALTTVRRTMLGLREYGPVLWAAYTGAEILGVRMQLPGGADPEDFDDPLDEENAPANEEDVAGSVPEDTTTARFHQHALYALRSQEMREKCGLTW